MAQHERCSRLIIATVEQGNSVLSGIFKNSFKFIIFYICSRGEDVFELDIIKICFIKEA